VPAEPVIPTNTEPLPELVGPTQEAVSI